ncbi:DUF7563 family protein [Halostagnicola larsenii]|uniref:DUF7563 family protein n=1 Tax=Halostagnicola larsenii TaxID=353800 RepID=UPI0012FB07EE|nr:hypothetical protein [Halostagnicola larsenii]
MSTSTFDQTYRPDNLEEPNADGPPQCQNCGTVVSRDYVRVFSDDPDNQRLQHCWNCKSRTQRY